MALRHPDRPAVRCSGRIVSHRELDEMVGALDSALPRGQTVAVRSGDRLDYIVGMLAAFRSGGTYLPLDAGAPAEREAFMLKDAGATVLLRDGVLTLLAEERSQTDTPSYAIYTSGTTGLPKGVWVLVDALSEHIAATVDRMGVTAQDVVLQFARPTVDVSIEQTLVALTAGACLVLPDRQLLSPRELLALLDAEGVTVANLPAGYFHDLVAELRERGGSPRALRLMVSGSDRLEPAAAAAWRELTGVPLLNAYGPTETVITATVHEVGPQAAGESVGIGAAVGERTLHILDEQLRPCPAGTAGELFIGGPLLAWGYRRRPGLSAERFVADPFSTLPGARMYRTGDLVRRQSEGGPLEYLGRTDHQLKIRGFRVEPGEVEQAVAGYPGITGCVVVEREGRLVAYATGTVPEYGQIREYLRERLPEQLLPSAVVALEAFPLTVNGKTDRAALPEPTAVPVAQAGFVAPRTAAERLIAQVWAEVLGVDRVGAEDNFFHLGGDSLTAVRMIGRVFDDFGMVSPYAIFDAPTLAAFAAAVSATGEPAGAPPSLDAKPNPLGTASLGTAPLGTAPLGTAPLSKFQRGLFFLDHWNAGAATYNVPWVFRFQGSVDPELLRGALDVVVSRHAPLRTVFVLEESGPQQRISDRITLPFTLVDAAADQVDGLIAEAARQPFELETGPLFRVDAVRTPDDRLTVVFTFHHLVWDEGSLPVLEQELQEAYQALAEGRPHRLPELRVGYPEYSAGQYTDGAAEAQLGYWQEALRGVAADSVLPTDHPRPDLQAFRGAQHHYALPPEAALAVRELARGEDATPYMVLLAALALTLHRRSGRTDLVVGAPVSLRGRAELTGLIGYFVNLLPLRVQVDPGASFRELVRQVRKVCVGGYRNQDAPFDDIAGLVLDDRPGDRIPLCQIVFELHPTDTRELSVGGVPVSRELHLNDVSRFDLTISVDDRGTDFTGRFEYDSDLFEAATIAALRDDWLATLAELVPAPATPAPAIPAPTAPPQIVVETVQARMERLVADTMREVLDRPRVDREDNFFRIGGTSLAALRVAMRLSRETGTRVPPHLVFRAKTVRAIAEQLAAQQQTGAAPAPQAAGKGARQ